MVDSLVSTVVGKLTTVLQDEVTLLVCVTDEITKLSDTFALIQAVLQDAESRRVKDEAVKIWMDKVKDVAYDVDDILDEWMTEAHRSEASDEGDRSCFGFLLTCFLCPVTCFKHALLRHKIGSGIKKVMGRLEDLEKVKNQLGLRVDGREGGRMDSEVRGGDIGGRQTTEWELVLESDIWSSESSDDTVQGILPALLLSYQDLRPSLKQCFAYLSIFPKDWKIEKDMTVKLWLAQGFICSDRSRDAEEIGGLYFDDLLRRSLLQDAELDDDKSIIWCKMHDLVHDLAQSVAGSDCSQVEIGKQASLNISNVRHSLVSDEDGDEGASNWDTLYKAHKLRTLLCYTSISRVVLNDLFDHFRHLRALDLSRTSIQKLPRTVGKLKHLRYLDLSWTDIEELPEGVSNCRNLQTLKLNYCIRLKKLPRGLRKMISLRHLELEYTEELKYLPQGIGSLSSLRTLTKFIVEGGNEGCKWGELKQLINQLQGSLEIEGLEKVRSTDEAREAELDKNHKLYVLSYVYRDDEASDDEEVKRLDDEEVKRMEEVLEILQPHTNLKEFKIRGYEGSKLPEWIVDPVFSNLVKVELYSCKKCKQLPGLGKLPSLKYLVIWGMDEVGKVGGEFSGDDNNDGSDGGGGGGGVSFPKLETLSIWDMRNWEEWELRGGDGEVMPSLLQLKILDCPKLKELPSNLPPLLQKLTLWGSDVGMSSGGSLPVLPNLNHLEISRNDELTSLPGGWLGQLKALQTLEISFCRRLGSLPEELQHLTMLQHLDIYYSPVLKERCGVGGEDHEKIAHIPNISFR